MGRKVPFWCSVRLQGRLLLPFSDSLSTSTLAIRLRSKPRRSSVPQRPVGLSLCRSLKASRKKSAAPGPTTLCAPGERIGEGRMSLALPRCLPKSTRWLHHPAMGKHSDQREPKPQERWRGAPYCQLRALPLRLESQVPAHLLEGHF